MGQDKKPLIIWGGTGNFKVLCELLGPEYNILGFFDRNTEIEKSYNGIPYLGNIESFFLWANNNEVKGIYFICSIGPGFGKDRIAKHEELKSAGLTPIVAIHSTAFVARNASISEGTQVYAKSAICVDVTIQRACIVNTSASIDHECFLDDGVTIGPGARLAGLVKVEKYVDIYTGAIILPRVKIGEGAIIGAGAVVRKDVPPYCVMAGNPARIIKEVER
jgi:sugar O-acyltransferase (sialic acid O-acetyltransferase NeuD family)